MEPNNLEGRSRGSSFRRRALTLVGVSALTLSGVGAAVFGASQAFASTGNTLNVAPFNLGTSVTNATFAVNNSVASSSTATVIDTIGFTATGGIAANGNITLTGFSQTATANSTQLLTDNTTGGSQTVTFGSATSGTLVASVPTAVPAGDSVTLTLLGNENPAITSSPISVKVNTSTDLNPVKSNTVTLTAGPASAGLSSMVTGASATLTATSSTGTAAVIAGSDYLLVSDSGSYAATGASEGALLPALASDFTVTDTITHASATVTGAVTIVNVGTATAGSYAEAAYFLSPISAAAGDNLVVQVTGVTNDTTAQIQHLQVINLGVGPITSPTSTGVTAASTTASLTSPQYVLATATVPGYWSTANPAADPGGEYATSSALGTSVSGLGVTLSNSTYDATGAVYTISFTAKTTTVGSTTIVVSGFTPGVGATLENMTTSTYLPVTVSGQTFTLTSDVLTANNSYTLVSSGVDNNTVSGSNTLKLHTAGATSGGDPVDASTTFTLVAAPIVGPFVSVSDVNVSAASTWTISGFKTAVQFSGGLDTITVDSATTGTPSVFPTGASNYTITDLTNSTGSGVATTVTGGNTSTATITVPNNIGPGDSLEIVITNVTNSSQAGAQANATVMGTSASISTSGATTLIGLAAPAAATTPASTPPSAAATGSNGALVNVNGTIYVYVGGVAFGIPTPAEFNTISTALGNPAVLTATSVTTTGTVASGSLVQVVGSPQINVVGSNGTAYGFSTAAQFLSDGYTWSKIVQVPSLGNLTVGTGTAPSAAATAGNGALVNVNGTIYVYAGGVAVGIPTPAEFNTISAALGNPTVVVASSVTTTGTMAAGTLVQVFGSPMVSIVGAAGAQTGFSTAAQFYSSGYSWANVIMIP